jgi:hypothetical protein
MNFKDDMDGENGGFDRPLICVFNGRIFILSKSAGYLLSLQRGSSRFLLTVDYLVMEANALWHSRIDLI